MGITEPGIGSRSFAEPPGTQNLLLVSYGVFTPEKMDEVIDLCDDDDDAALVPAAPAVTAAAPAAVPPPPPPPSPPNGASAADDASGYVDQESKEEEDVSEPLAQLRDVLPQFGEAQIRRVLKVAVGTTASDRLQSAIVLLQGEEENGMKGGSSDDAGPDDVERAAGGPRRSPAAPRSARAWRRPFTMRLISGCGSARRWCASARSAGIS